MRVTAFHFVLLAASLCLYWISVINSTPLASTSIGEEYEDLEVYATEDNSVQSYITETQKEQIFNALKGVQSLIKFLHEAKFFEMLTTVTGVAGPIFSVAMVVLNIVFMFIHIESAEMKQLKIEFKNLNNRLDKWSEEFSEVKRMIDWNAIQVSFGQHERTINTMSEHLNSLVNAPEGIRETQRQLFISKYESSFLNTAEKLYSAMVNTESIFSENLFRASQLYTENHRPKVQQFMMGNFQLLMKAVQIQASYIHMRYNSTQATEFTKGMWEKKFEVLKERMAKIDQETKDHWSQQYQRDLDSLLAKHYSLSNKDFVQVAHNHMAAKYDWREWFIVTYKELGGWDNHAAFHCGGSGGVRFRSHGRNLQIASVEPLVNDGREVRVQKAVQLMNDYERSGVPRRDGDHAKTVMLTFAEKNAPDTCDPFKYIGAVKWGSDVWYMSNQYMSYRKLCVHGGSCFNVFLVV